MDTSGSTNNIFFDDNGMWVEYDSSFGFVICDYDRITYLTNRNGDVHFDGSYKVKVLRKEKENMELHIIHKDDIIYGCSIWYNNICTDLYTSLQDKHKHQHQTNIDNFWNYLPTLSLVRNVLEYVKKVCLH